MKRLQTPLKIISALLLFYMAPFYLFYGMSITALGGLDWSSVKSVTSAVFPLLTGALCLSVGITQFMKRRPRAIMVLIFCAVVTHLVAIWVFNDLQNMKNEFIEFALESPDVMPLDEVKAEFNRAGLLHAVLMIIPILVNFGFRQRAKHPTSTTFK